ncbi:MAG: DNA polymerase III subunit alpha [Tuberibacillus sp.]
MRVLGFSHLHVHSEYSLLDSTCRIEQLVDQAVSLGMSSLAITDTGVLYGAVPFYKACRAKGIHPIIGLEVPLTNEVGGQRRVVKQNPFSLILLAENQEGYRNLVKISTLIQTNRHKTIDKHALQPLTSGLIALSGGPKGEIEAKLQAKDYEGAKKLADLYKKLFPNRFYIELQDHGLASERELLLEAVRLGQELNIPLVATNDVHYLNDHDFLAHQCLTAVRTGTTLKELRDSGSNNQYYLKSSEEMAQTFQAYPEAIAATEIIAERCHVTFEFGHYLLPKFPLPSEYNSADYLKQLCYQGAIDRFGELNDEAKRRLDYELSVIDQMGFNDYFLIVWDVVRYAKRHGIRPGPGRGSAAGALVSYALGITDVDPLEHNLLFERFLNPERVSMPDIDIDFPDNRRDEMIAYVNKKYGSERVAQIGTFGTLAAKAAIRDIGRVLELSTSLVDRVAGAIPSKPGVTLKQAFHESKQLQELVNKQKEARTLFRLAHLVEGLPRHSSVHAAGIVITQDPLTDLVPLAEGSGGIHVTQYPMEVLEPLGLLKMDFLSLRNLTLIEQILDSIEMEKGVRPNVDEFPNDDPLTFKLLSDGDTTGIFQFEREGLRAILKKLKPTSFEDLVAVNALNRPGPMENIPVFIDAKHGKAPIKYPHPDLEPILKPTYGIIVYQEQIMQVASKMAGYSLGEADILRRAVSKKKRDVLEREEAHFIEGCLKNGYSREVAKTLYDWIVKFADYGFNRSHSVAYTLIAYWLAYLKAHEPKAFMTALMSSVIHHPDKLSEYRFELSKKGIRVLPPSINKSDAMFKSTPEGILYGLNAIKNVGSLAVQGILKERKKRPFTGLFDLCQRTVGYQVNRRTLEALITSGSLDEFGVDRAVLLASLDRALKMADKNEADGQTTLGFESDVTEAYADVPPLSLQDKLKLEQEALGFYLTAHPIERYADKVKKLGTVTIQQVREEPSGAAVKLPAMVEQFRQLRTKTGRQMGTMVLNDPSGSIEAVAFPDVFEKSMRLYQNGALVWVEGTMKTNQNGKQLVIQKIRDLADITITGRLFLRISSKEGSSALLNRLKKSMDKYRGNTDVLLYYAKEKQTIQLSRTHAVEPTTACIKELKAILGDENVILQ